MLVAVVVHPNASVHPNLHGMSRLIPAGMYPRHRPLKDGSNNPIPNHTEPFVFLGGYLANVREGIAWLNSTERHIFSSINKLRTKIGG